MLAYALGFAHAQDRFFQMDLLRRNSAGELAEIIGPPVVKADRKVRVHRFRDVARRVLAEGSEEDRALLEAYAKGVNAGLGSLAVKPFEYLLLGLQPAAWQPEDSVLVMFSMYLDLQGEDYRRRSEAGIDARSAAAGDVRFRRASRHAVGRSDPGRGVRCAADPRARSLRHARSQSRSRSNLLAPPGALPPPDTFHPGSNNWAVSGKHTADGRALLADDMHLGIRVPHVWYRASLVWPDDERQVANA